MARRSKWSQAERVKLLKMIKDGVAEQVIREKMGSGGKAMTSVEFAQQLKMAMVEDGTLKQATRAKSADKPRLYEVTKGGRLTLSDFAQITGYKSGNKFTLQKPRGRSKAWRIVPE